MVTIDRTGSFEANTYSVFSDVLLAPMFSAEARYDYQDRPQGDHVHRGRFVKFTGSRKGAPAELTASLWHPASQSPSGDSSTVASDLPSSPEVSARHP
jgi:hypothetical protein